MYFLPRSNLFHVLADSLGQLGDLSIARTEIVRLALLELCEFCLEIFQCFLGDVQLLGEAVALLSECGDLLGELLNLCGLLDKPLLLLVPLTSLLFQLGVQIVENLLQLAGLGSFGSFSLLRSLFLLLELLALLFQLLGLSRKLLFHVLDEDCVGALL